MTDLNTEQQEEQKSQDIINQLRKSKKLYDDFTNQFYTQYKISGKLINEWKYYFKITVPPDINTATAKQLASRLSELHQEASFMKSAAEARLQACKANSSNVYREEYARLVAEYRSKGEKLPAKDTLVALAEKAVGALQDMTVHIEIELSFWKEILNDLANVRKLIDIATINLGIEAKVLAQHGGYHG